jgi:hypothetical protein
MDTHLFDEAVIREYLLGRLDNNAELVEAIDEQVLTNPRFSETIEVIEDEIIEEYLERSLSAGDARAVEEHFLRPPERQRMLRSARLLKHQLSRASVSSEGVTSSRVRKFPAYRTLAELAAAVLVIVSSVSLINLRGELQVVVRESGQRLDQERQRAEALRHQLDAALGLAHPATAMLSLLEPGIRRGDAQLPELTVGTGTRTIHVEIALPSATPELYSVQLESGGQTVWSADKIVPFTARAGALLMFDFPAGVLRLGQSRFVVRTGSRTEASYWFVVSRL